MGSQISPPKQNDLPAGVLRVLEMLENAGYEAWLVGGCVRDRLRGVFPKDYDVTTNALTDEVIAVFDGFRVIATGLKHGTVTVIAGGMPVEVTTYRVDGAYSDGRHPDSVRFASDIRSDLSRRDFTVNAMAYSPRRGYLDLFGGMNDLSAGIIRCVGDPDRRFGEDALRILRALRFASVLGFDIEPDTAQAVHRCRKLLGKIAVERITQELLGLLCGVNAGRVLRQYPDVIAGIIPPCASMVGFAQHNPHHDFDVWEHTTRVVDAAPPERILRLAALLHDVGKPSCFSSDEKGIGHFYGHAAKGEEISREIFAGYLRTERRTEERVLFLVAHHDEPIIPERKIIRRRLARYGEEPFRQLLALNRADITGQLEVPEKDRLAALDDAGQILDGLAGESACTTLQSLEISGGDLMAMGIPKGPMIGTVLHRLLGEVCDESLTNSGEALKARAAGLFNELKQNKEGSDGNEV